MKLSKMGIVACVLILIGSCNNKQTKVTFKGGIVINDNVALYRDTSGSMPVEMLKYMDKIEVMDEEIVNNLIQVKVINGNIGWVKVDEVSYLTKEWIRYTKLEEIVFYIPNNINYQSMGGEKRKINKINTLEKEYKFISRENTIGILFLNEDYANRLKIEEEGKSPSMKALGAERDYDEFISYNHNNIESYYKAGKIPEGNPYYSLIIKRNNGKTIIFHIHVNFDMNDSQVKTRIDIAKKILFSISMK
ncbi:MAG: hypothetical protein EPN93_05230 [Spirochaetes bacterium]|nr:MAG: hypothetical protein EPN93_05230 [Spirochaetota bacterium]